MDGWMDGWIGGWGWMGGWMDGWMDGVGEGRKGGRRGNTGSIFRRTLVGRAETGHSAQPRHPHKGSQVTLVAQIALRTWRDRPESGCPPSPPSSLLSPQAWEWSVPQPCHLPYTSLFHTFPFLAPSALPVFPECLRGERDPPLKEMSFWGTTSHHRPPHLTTPPTWPLAKSQAELATGKAKPQERHSTIYTLLYILFLLYIHSVHVGVNAVK
ncbi:PREDICTED: uncharacterized protein LOC105594361 [Cercocebus atys]|uniref:uncharacterized protein LOC105594361 n=1 Tax=Cercocebus atys TaxID=9531 RepID=UPI0005F3C5AA|nr:PREDICTED: uncharacterized protein LOC105594361 [Cercocebus atys]